MTKKILGKETFKLFILISIYFLSILIFYNIFSIINLKSFLMPLQIFSIILPIIVYVIFFKNKCKYMIITIMLYLIITVGLPFLFCNTYDTTVDGNSYHKTAIGYMKEGWNPFYESSLKFQSDDKIPKLNKTKLSDKWIDHYPKASWIISSSMYSMTNNIESGKSFNLILTISMCLLSYSFFSIVFKRKEAFLISILLALNPIIICQLFSFYIDGILGICFVNTIILLLIISESKENNKWIWLCFISNACIFVNLKFTGLLYCGLISAFFYFYWMFRHRKEIKYIGKITIYFSIAFLVSILLVGSNSYLKNTLEHNNPLYPILGKGKIDIITTMQPKQFEDKTMTYKFIKSIFSKTANASYDSGKVELKFPIKVYDTEKEALQMPDVRIAGFGPLSALMFIISTLSIFIIIIKYIIKKDKKLILLILTLSIIGVCTILVGENWWARYVPQVYLLPIISIIGIEYILKINKNILMRVLSLMIIVIVLINSAFFLSTFKKKINYFNDAKLELNTLKEMGEIQIELVDESLSGVYFNLKDKRINFEVIKFDEHWKYRLVFYNNIKLRIY